MNRGSAALIAVLTLAAQAWAGPKRSSTQVPQPRRTTGADATVFKPGDGPDNAAIYYMAALNSYQSRRAPQRGRDDLLKPRKEPTPNETELAAIIRGSEQRKAIFYPQDGSPPLFHVRTGPTTPAWPLAPSTDPFTLRPYVAVWTSLSDAALKLAQARVATHGVRSAARLMLAVGTMGRHLRMTPGALCDTELGIHCEIDALHHLVKLYDRMGMHAESRHYDAAFRAVLADQRKIRQKFSRLDDIGFACELARDDPSLVWRVEAVAALVTAAHDERLTAAEGARVKALLLDLRSDPSATIRRAVAHLTTLPPRMFQPVPPPSQEPRHRSSKRPVSP